MDNLLLIQNMKYARMFTVTQERNALVRSYT